MDLNNDLRQFRPSRLSGAFLQVVRQVRGPGGEISQWGPGTKPWPAVWRAEPPPP